jgi:hypothetical protein
MQHAMTLFVSNDIELRLLSEEHVEDIFNTIYRERAYLRVWLPFVDFLLTAWKIFGDSRRVFLYSFTAISSPL